MDDERIEHALKLGPVDEPSYQTGMRTKLAGGHESPTVSPPAAADVGLIPVAALNRIDVHRRGGSAARRGPRVGFAQIAAVLAIVVVVGAIAVPSLVGRLRGDRDLLARITEAPVSIGVLETLPQTVSSGGVHIGFDVDVARALADRLGLDMELAALHPTAFQDAPWDLGLGPAGLVASSPIVASQPYAYWPAWVAVPTGSPIQSAADLDGTRLCVALGSSAVSPGVGPLAALGGVVVVARDTDDACILALGDGQADGMVTTVLLDDELPSRGLRALPGGPLFHEPRVIQIRGSGEEAATVLAAVNRAIDDLRATGRLADLSRQSFGGRDLTEANR